MKFQTTKKPIVLFSAIGLTDIVLLLLIFFLLSSSFIVQPGIKVHLPKSASAQTESDQQINIIITKHGEIYLNDRMISEAELGGKLRVELARSPDRLVVIKADKDISLERAIAVIDIAKLAGVQKFMIATSPQL